MKSEIFSADNNDNNISRRIWETRVCKDDFFSSPISLSRSTRDVRVIFYFHSFIRSRIGIFYPGGALGIYLFFLSYTDDSSVSYTRIGEEKKTHTHTKNGMNTGGVEKKRKEFCRTCRENPLTVAVVSRGAIVVICIIIYTAFGCV